MEATITRSKVIEQESRLYEAIIEGNINILEKLLHNDLLFIIPSGIIKLDRNPNTMLKKV